MDRTMKNFWFSFAMATLFCLGLAAFSHGAETPKPMPNIQTDDVTDTLIGRKPQPKDPLKEGLEKIDAPKFFFGAGVLVTLIAAVVKIAIIVAVAFVIVHYIRHRHGFRGVEKKDPVDALIFAFDDLVNRVNGERSKHLTAAEKLGNSLSKLKSGITDRVNKE